MHFSLSLSLSFALFFFFFFFWLELEFDGQVMKLFSRFLVLDFYFNKFYVPHRKRIVSGGFW
jgi:hypothetical protein